MDSKLCTLMITLIAFWLPSHDANAAYNNRALRQKAVGSCQAPLPIYDSQLRKRPVGILNESSSQVFVSCGVTTNVFAQTTRVDVEFTNRSGTPVTINCTLVTGSPMGFVTYFPKELYLPAPLAGTVLVWDSSENNNQPYDNEQAISCALPAGVEINSTGVIYSEWSN